jgi:hypothetical protein
MVVNVNLTSSFNFSKENKGRVKKKKMENIKYEMKHLFTNFLDELGHYEHVLRKKDGI